MWSTSFAEVILPLSRQCTQSGLWSKNRSRNLRQRWPYRAEELFAPPHETGGWTFKLLVALVAKRGLSIVSLVKTLAHFRLRRTAVKINYVRK